jgi:nucleoside-diphosphate-sugar epimerase
MSILLTGATGFIGSHLLSLSTEFEFKAVVRNSNFSSSIGNDVFYLDSISSLTNWREAFHGVSVVVHCAARAHIMTDLGIDTLECYRQTNTAGTLTLARQAAAAGVNRFIFISTIGVNGLITHKPFKFDDFPDPQEAYAVSKYEAEAGLQEIAKETGMEVVIIRPPLVYGANAPGTFGRFSALAKKNFPLPLGAIDNKRSLVSIDNLVDLITTCIDHPKAANQTFLVSDDNDVSTSHLLRLMILSAGKTPLLLPVSVNILRFFAGLLGKESVIDRMSSNLQVDISHTKSTLGWKPPVSFEEGIRRCFK